MYRSIAVVICILGSVGIGGSTVVLGSVIVPTKPQLLHRSQAIAVVNVERIHAADLKSKYLEFQSKATAQVERVISGKLERRIQIYCNSKFICDNDTIRPGRHLVFLKQPKISYEQRSSLDHVPWAIEGYWSVRSIEEEHVRWYDSEEGVGFTPQPLEEVIESIECFNRVFESRLIGEQYRKFITEVADMIVLADVHDLQTLSTQDGRSTHLRAQLSIEETWKGIEVATIALDVQLPCGYDLALEEGPAVLFLSEPTDKHALWRLVTARSVFAVKQNNRIKWDRSFWFLEHSVDEVRSAVAYYLTGKHSQLLHQ